METEYQEKEEEYFALGTRVYQRGRASPNSCLYDEQDPSTYKCQAATLTFTGGENSSSTMGAATVISVKKGDTVALKAFFNYPDPSNDSGFDIQQSPALGIALGSRIWEGLASVGTTDAAVSLLPLPGSNGNEVPHAYGRIVMIDENGNEVSSTEVSELIDSGGKDSWDSLQIDWQAPQDGHVAVYIANESKAGVYFDDVEVTHSRLVWQENAYYPFGLAIKPLEREGQPDHRFTYNGKELEEETQWHEYGARRYDAQTSRWGGVDPLADIQVAYSPYAYVYCNPISYSDPSGMIGENHIASTFVNNDGVVVNHIDDGDPFVYLVGDNWDGESKNGLPILGFERPGVDYKKGDKYEHYVPLLETVSKDSEAIAGAVLMTGGLVADDATVVGVVDDVLIPVIWGGVLLYVIFNDDGSYEIAYPIDDTSTKDPDDKAFVIYIDGLKTPEAAQHGKEAMENGILNFGVLDRIGGSARRKANLRGIPTRPGKDRDEFPPSVLAPAGGVSVKHIDLSDNRRAGRSIGHQLKSSKNGTKVIVIPINVD